jgi:TolB-like protein/DNA-binding SARP family transcriptional activator
MASRAQTTRHRRVGPSGWRVEIGGCFAVLDGSGRNVAPRGRKARAILAYLASRLGEQVARESLTELLWGDRGEAQARASLRQALLEIRHNTATLVSADRDHLWIDADRIELTDEVPGEAFEDLDHITAEFDDWLAVERARLTRERLGRLRHEAEHELASGEAEAALAMSADMSRIDPFDEDGLRIAMQAEFDLGRPAGAEQRYQAMAQLLRDEMGLQPAAESKALRERLLIAGRTEIVPLFEGPTEVIRPPRALFRARTLRWKRAARWTALVALPVAVLGAFWWQQDSAADAQAQRIAILPFEAEGVEPALAEGLSDELLTQLTRSNQLRVIGRTSSSQFKGKPADLRKIGRMLDVKYIVEGSVRSSGNQMTALVSLVRAKDGSAVWARAFKTDSGSAPPIEAAIGGAIAQSLAIQPLPIAKSTPDREAFALYVRAKSLIRDRDADGMPKAVELLRQAVTIDPNFAGAWAQLAGATFLNGDEDVVVDLGGPKPVRMSRREAAQRALRLDPNLAEAHEMFALVDGSGPSARYHLKRALELNPSDTQALYWWGTTALLSGDYKRGGEIVRRAAALDPLWKRPVQEAITSSLTVGDRAAALRYLRTIKEGNPTAAVEVEAQMAFNEADFSRIVQLELVEPKGHQDSGWVRAIFTLGGLGFAREALLIANAPPFVRAVFTGHMPPMPQILDRLRLESGWGDDLGVYEAVTWELAKERRWSELATIYDAGIGTMQQVKGTDPGGRQNRQILAPIYAIALNRVGRHDEAARLALAADDAARFTLARGAVQAEPLVAIAGTEAILGHKEDALKHLEEAFAKNWRMGELLGARLGDRPEFATLRGDPRFERLRQIQADHLAKERREVEALHLF